jgi:hypothetical protein
MGAGWASWDTWVPGGIYNSFSDFVKISTNSSRYKLMQDRIIPYIYTDFKPNTEL